jgi:competence protein ComEA
VLPSGDGQKGGDFESWLYLVPDEQPNEGLICGANLGQLAVGMWTYVSDRGELPPPETWSSHIRDYMREGDAILACPSRPQAIRYAVNAQLFEVTLEEIELPIESIVVLFESALGHPNPVGGAAAVPGQGVHDGRINVAFADGHVELVDVDTAKGLLEQRIAQPRTRGIVDINTVRADELSSLAYIDPELAAAIVEHRDDLPEGRFTSADELLVVPDIDRDVLGRIAPLITVRPAGTPSPALVDINSATAEEIDTLPGIGPERTRRIVERRRRRPFTEARDLLEVDGIGEATLAGLRDRIRF